MAKMMAPDSVGSDSVYLANTAENQGYYLMLVSEGHEDKRPTKDGFEMMDGFSAQCEIVGGPNDGKKWNLLLYNGKLTHKDNGKAAAQKQFSFLVATDVCKPDQLGTEFEFDPSESSGSMFFIELSLGKAGEDGKQYLELHYSNIYHVDDPRAAKIKLDDSQRARIAAIKPAYRHTKDYFAKILAKPSETSKSETVAKTDFSDL